MRHDNDLRAAITRLPRIANFAFDFAWRQPREERVALAAGELWAGTSRAKCLLVFCVSGQVWLTQAGEMRDVMLAAGELFVCKGGRKVVVQALSAAARIEVHEHEPALND
jgi:hypothetical protein